MLSYGRLAQVCQKFCLHKLVLQKLKVCASTRKSLILPGERLLLQLCKELTVLLCPLYSNLGTITQISAAFTYSLIKIGINLHRFPNDTNVAIICKHLLFAQLYPQLQDFSRLLGDPVSVRHLLGEALLKMGQYEKSFMAFTDIPFCSSEGSLTCNLIP